MEMAAKVGTELALSGLFRVVSILDDNFRYVITSPEMKNLNDFVDYKIEALTGEAKSDDLVQLMPLLGELQAAALELEDLLDLYEYDQIEKQVNASSSEPIPKEKVLPTHLRNGLNKLLMIVERLENTRRSQAPYDSFIDFLVGESHVARPVIKLALSDISRAIQTFDDYIAFHEYWKQLKNVVSYHIQALIRYINSNDLAQSMQLQEMLQAASLELDMIGSYIDEQQVSSSFPNPPEKFKPILTENLELIPRKSPFSFALEKYKEKMGYILPKSPLRIGLEKLLEFVEQVEKKHPLITSRKDTTQPQANTITPTLRIGVETWLKFVEQVEKEHPFITSKKDRAQPQTNTFTPQRTEFLPLRGFLSVKSLENVKCQEDAEEIMRNHKKILNKVIFGWSYATDTCEEVLEILEPHRNLQNLSIIGYSCAKFPKWMVKENWHPRLQTLELESCRSLKVVPFLPPRLQVLLVYNCHELTQLPLISDTLVTLELVGCPKLTPSSMFNKSLGLSDLSLLTNLVRFELRGFPNLQALTNLSPTMNKLTIEDCPKLTSLGNLHHCTSLVYLSILKCPMLMKEKASLVEGVVVGDIADRFPQVESIVIDEPFLVLVLIQQKALRSTQRLSLRRLYRPFLHMFDENFHQFPSLNDLTFEDCATVPNLEKLSSLKRLIIRKSEYVELLPNLPVSLQYLEISDSPRLYENYKKGSRLRSTISQIPQLYFSNSSSYNWQG